MSVSDLGNTAVVDRRPTPRGVLPKGIQTWLMVGIAGLIVVIIMFAGQPQAPERSRPVEAVPQATSPDRVRDYQERLNAINAQLTSSLRPAAVTFEPEVPTVSVRENLSPQPRVDPLAVERQRRDYESLFASNVVVSRRQLLEQTAAARYRASDDRVGGGNGVEPSLDEVADAVVRATTRAAGATAEQPRSGVIETVAPPRKTASVPADSLAPGPRYRVGEGTIIDAVLTNRLDGGASAPVNCLVTNAVYSEDSRVLIPAGARVLGETRAVEGWGETRLAVSFHRIVMPDGSFASLDHFRGLNQFGDSGLRDQVDRHYWSTFGGAAAVGLVGGLSQLLGNVALGSGDGDRTVIVAGGSADATSQAAATTLSQFLNRMPTITIREGHRVKIYVTRDFELPEWVGAAGTGEEQ